MKLRRAITWGAMLTASGLLGCAGKADSGAHRGGETQGGAAAVGSGGSVGGDSVGGGNVGGDSVGGGNVGGRGGAGGVELNVSGGLGGLGSTMDLLLTTSAWDVNLAADLLGDAPPTELVLTLAIRDDAGALTGILSRDGRVSTLGLSRESGVRVRLVAGDSGVRFALSGRNQLTGLMLKALTLTAFDDDADGVADRLVGTGDGALEESCGDCTYSRPVSLALSGKPDRTPPKLQGLDSLNPVDTLTLATSEALKSAKLELSGGVSAPLSDSAPTPPINFSTTAVLPFSAAFKIIGAGEDFAAWPLDLSAATVTTIDDPGIFAEDGFETKPNAALSGGSKWVDASSGLPIPNGSGALLLPPGSAATFHLRRPAGIPTLSVHAVALGNAEANGAWLQLDAAVIGGLERSGQFAPLAVGTQTTSAADWTRASEAQTVQLTLTDPFTDVAVRIAAWACTGGPCPVPGALLIDDLRIE